MYQGKKVSKLELKNSLLQTLAYNEDALDYIKNAISRTENVLGIDPADEIIQNQLRVEKYIEFSLNYLDKKYTDELKKLGVKL